jgi:hypothetical protein
LLALSEPAGIHSRDRFKENQAVEIGAILAGVVKAGVRRHVFGGGLTSWLVTETQGDTPALIRRKDRG